MRRFKEILSTALAVSSTGAISSGTSSTIDDPMGCIDFTTIGGTNFTSSNGTVSSTVICTTPTTTTSILSEPDVILEIGDDVFEVFTHQKRNVSEMERRAQRIYDVFDKNHVKENDVVMIAETSEVAELLHDIVDGKTREELLIELEAIKKAKMLLVEEESSKKRVKIKGNS